MTFQARPQSEHLVDIHIYVVPPELWRQQLHSAVNEVVTDSISLGFIRVAPATYLANLRDDIAVQLGEDLIPKHYVYLKSVGRCLTQVKSRQEKELRVKHFLPPHAYAQEIYILDANAEPIRDSPSTIYNHSFSPRSHNALNYQPNLYSGLEKDDPYVAGQGYTEESPRKGVRADYAPDKGNGLTASDVLSGSGVVAPASNLLLSSKTSKGNLNGRSIDEDNNLLNQSLISQNDTRRKQNGRKAGDIDSDIDAVKPHVKSSLSIHDDSDRDLSPERSYHATKPTIGTPTHPNDLHSSNNFPGERSSRDGTTTPFRKGTYSNLGRAAEHEPTTNSQVGNDDPDLYPNDGNNKNVSTSRRNNQSKDSKQTVWEEGLVSTVSTDYEDLREQQTGQAHQRVGKESEMSKEPRGSEPDSREYQNQKEHLYEQLEKSRLERKAEEKRREELVKKARAMQVRTNNRRNQAREMWKNRYYDEKKKTPALEADCQRLRAELDSQHRKYLLTLEGAQNSSLSRPVSKGNQVVQAAKLRFEVDDLQRRADAAKMKLTAEMKLRNQAETELRALRAELTQKKMNMNLTRSQWHSNSGTSTS